MSYIKQQILKGCSWVLTSTFRNHPEEAAVNPGPQASKLKTP